MRKTLHLLWMFMIALGLHAQTPVYEFNFDGNMNNSGAGSFGGWTVASGTAATYVNNRAGQAGSAINLPGNLLFNGAIAGNLPQGNNPRTLAFWVKFINDDDGRNFPVAGWGNNAATQAFGFWRNGVQNSYYTWGVGNDYSVPQTNAQNQANSNNGWVHIAMTHNGSTMTIYFNGVDAGNYSRTLNTNGTMLYLNRLVNSSIGNGSAIQLDDLKIYNTALSGSEILTLFNPTATANIPVISNVSQSSTTSNSATVHFDMNPGGANSSTYISVTEIGAGIGSVYDGPMANGTNTQSLTYTITGLTPGKCYTFNVMGYNSSGSSPVSADKGFCTYDANANKTPIYHFEFNGNTTEKNDPTLAFGNPNSGYTDNNTAIRLNNNVQSISLPLIAQGSERRTVAIRVFFESGALSQENNVFSYGTATNNQSFGYNQDSQMGTHYYWANDISFGNPMNFGTWYDMVFTYDGMDIKVYKNGTEVGSGSFTPNTIGTMFRLGRTSTGLGGYFNGRIDDLRIYNESFNSSDASSLHSTLSNEIFNPEDSVFGLYPNPTDGILNISSSEALQLVEIYNLQGQKILQSSQSKIDVSQVSSGIYLIKVQTTTGQTATRKFTVK